MTNKEATMRLERTLSEPVRAELCRNLDYNGKTAIPGGFSAEYRNGFVYLTHNRSKTTIELTFDTFEYKFLFGDPVEGRVA